MKENFHIKKLRSAARGADCTANIVGVCSYDSSTTVLCHFNFGDKGAAIKSSDFSAGICCSNCHDAIDRRVESDEFLGNKYFYLARSIVRTINFYFKNGIINCN